jgi:hypothetical protein
LYNTIIIGINNNSALINNIYGTLGELTRNLLFKIPIGTRKSFSEIDRKVDHIPSKSVDRPVLGNVSDSLKRNRWITSEHLSLSERCCPQKNDLVWPL